MQYANRYDTYGIDFNNDMIEIARQNLSRKGVKATLQWANVEALPFPDNYFDTIVNTMAFTGYANGEQAMSQF